MQEKNNGVTQLEVTIAIVLICFGFLLFSLAFFTGTSRAESAECLGWQQDAATYPNYYLTAWQKAQCDHYGIKISAPVK